MQPHVRGGKRAIMTDPISAYGRLNQSTLNSRRELEGTEKPTNTVTGPQQSGNEAASTRPLMDDELVLSETARSIAATEAFDREKVEAIKLAISNGNYPLDSRRIAENFFALERLL